MSKLVNNSVDKLLLLRGYACFLVIASHSAGMVENRSWFMYAPAWAGIWIFFILSGYLMGKGFYKGRYEPSILGAVNFYKNRALRIFPLYFFSIFIISILMQPNITKKENIELLFQLATFTFNGELLKNGYGFLNGPLWSISTEFQYYLSVPLLYCFFYKFFYNKKIATKILLISIIVYGLIYRIFFMLIFGFSDNYLLFNSNWHKYIFVPFISNFDLFLSGFLLNDVVNKNYFKSDLQKLKYEKIALILLIIVYLVFAYISYEGIFQKQVGFKLFYYIVTPTIIVLFTIFYIYCFENNCNKIKNNPLSFKNIKNNPARIIEIFGILTYGLYIWHGPILITYASYYHSENVMVNFLYKLAVGFILSSIIAAITYFIIEKPFEKFKMPLKKNG